MAKALLKGSPWYIHAAIIVSMALIIAGFTIPPSGVIDGSVLTAVGELLGGVTLITFVSHIPQYLEAGYKAKITHGNTTVEISDDDDDDEKAEEYPNATME